MGWIRDAIAVFEKNTDHKIDREVLVFITETDLVDFSMRYNRPLFVAKCFLQLDKVGVLDTDTKAYL